MKIKITVGEVSINTDGLDLSKKDIKTLLKWVTGIAMSISSDEQIASTPLGFTAHIERANPLPEESWFTDDEE